MNRQPLWIWKLAVLSLLAVATALPAFPATVARLELDEVRGQAVSVFSGQVVGMTQRVGDGGKMVWRDYQIDVTESLAGNDPGSTAVLSFAGGTVGKLSIGITDSPYLENGKHYVFFVQSGTLRPVPTVGWGQGLYSIEKVLVGSQPKQILVSWDGEPLQLSSDGRLMRGPAIDIENGVVVDGASIRREDRGQRVSATVFESADGTVVAQPATKSATYMQPARTFATIDDVRLFIQGKLGFVPERVHNR